MAPFLGDLKVTFEIHLPEVIGSVCFKRFPFRVLGRFLRIDVAVSFENRVNRACGRNRINPKAGKQNTNFSPSPGRECLSYFKDRLLAIKRSGIRAAKGSPGPIAKTGFTPGNVAVNLFISSLTADSKPPAKLGYGVLIRACQSNKFFFFGHERFHLQ